MKTASSAAPQHKSKLYRLSLDAMEGHAAVSETRRIPVEDGSRLPGAVRLGEPFCPFLSQHNHHAS